MFFSNNIGLVVGVSATIAAVVYVIFGPHETKRRRKNDCCPGLINHGSTCFLNALLQSLAPCYSFGQWLQEFVGRHTVGSSLPFSSTVSTVLRVLNNGDVSEDFEDAYSPRAVIDALKAKRWIITSDEQDAHELFHVFTETLDEEVRGHSTNGVSLFDIEGVESNFMCPGVTRISSPLPQLSGRELHPFRGLLVSQLQCQLCGYKCPMKYDTFDSLSVSIPSYHPQLGGLTLDMLLRKFVHSETVHNVTCDNCNRTTTGTSDAVMPSPTKKSSFWKKLSLGKTPRCLCIHLQRTAWLDSGLPVKRCEHVTFPEVLDLTAYMYTTMKVKRRLSGLTEAGLVGGRHGDTPSRPSSVVKPYPAAVNLLKARHYEHRLSPNGLRVTGEAGASEGASPRTQALATIYSRDTPPGATRGSYRLVSVIVHQGGVQSGHFVTYRRAPATDGQQFSSVWLYTSDTVVRTASLTEVLDATAYMLFYEKI